MYCVTSYHVIFSLKNTKWKLSKYKNFRPAEKWDTTVTEVEMQKDTPQLRVRLKIWQVQQLWKGSVYSTGKVQDIFRYMGHFPDRRQLCAKLTSSFKIFILEIQNTKGYLGLFYTTILWDIKMSINWGFNRSSVLYIIIKHLRSS